jgi:thymidylate kinase
MAESTPDETDGLMDFSALLIGFISTVLEKERRPRPAEGRQKGAFAVLIGLDGSGKTTLARNLSRLIFREMRYDGVRYFHWRAKIFGQIEFPLPEFRDVPRKESLPKTIANSLLSSLRLLKNVFLANVAYQIRIRHLLRHNYLVMIDRYFYNYYLDPDSVKYTGPDWLLKALLGWFPKPDVIVTLNASAEILLARKQELSPDQIARQISIKDNLNFRGTPCVAVDARDSAANVAEKTLAAMSKAAVKASVVVLCLSRLLVFIFPSSN